MSPRKTRSALWREQFKQRYDNECRLFYGRQVKYWREEMHVSAERTEQEARADLAAAEPDIRKLVERGLEYDGIE